MSKAQKNRTRKLCLDTFEARDVPATLVNLTTPGTAGEVNGAIVQQFDSTNTPANTLDTFARLRSNGGEQGYNTDARPLQYDEARNRSVTHSLKLSSVSTQLVGGTYYREFILDVNQRNNSSRIDLTEVRLFLGATGNLRNYNTHTDRLNGQEAIYDLDETDNVTVRLNSRLNRRGKGDMVLLVPNEAFGNASPDTYVYLYSKFAGGNGGAEDWTVRKTPVAPPPPPPPAAASFSGQVFYDRNANGVFEATGSSETTDIAFGGISVELRRIIAPGQSVVVETVTTNDEGFYSFSNVPTGKYSIFRLDSPGGNYSDGLNIVGTIGGILNGESEELGDAALEDAIVGINYVAGQVGLGYNFTIYDGFN